MKKINLNKIFKKFKIHSNDSIMIHGDIGAINQLTFSKSDNIEDKLLKFYRLLVNKYNFNGTLLIPTFTYSFCKKKIFDKNKSQSEIGLFSEITRKINLGKRTLHPIFSFKIYGKKTDYFLNASNNTCFGVNSIFDKFIKQKGKIMCIGCNFDMITFIHYIEQLTNVPYRYHKNFRGKLLDERKNQNIKVSYFVKKMKYMRMKKFYKIHNEMYNNLYSKLINNKKIIECKFGRYNSLIVKSNDMLNYGKKILLKDKILNLK